MQLARVPLRRTDRPATRRPRAAHGLSRRRRGRRGSRGHRRRAGRAGLTVRTLVAGFGNVLRGDDGFGVEVDPSAAGERAPLADVELMEVGTAGIRLAQELLTPYDRLIIVDAMTRGGAPGTVYVSRGGVCRAARRGRSAPGDPVPRAGGRQGARRSAAAGVHRGLRAGGGRRADDGADTAQSAPPWIPRSGRTCRRLLAGGRAPIRSTISSGATRSSRSCSGSTGKGSVPMSPSPTSSGSSTTSERCAPPSVSSSRTVISRRSAGDGGVEPVPPDSAGRARRPAPVPRRVRAVPGAARAWRMRLGGLRLPPRRHGVPGARV